MNIQSHQTQSRFIRSVSASEGTPLAIACAWALAKILGLKDFGDFNPHRLDTTEDCLDAAESLGYRAGSSTVPHWFVGTPLADAWERGSQFQCECEDNAGGSQEEWDALSAEKQDESWEAFHDLCARGVGENHRFYDLLMNKWLVGYVGH